MTKVFSYDPEPNPSGYIRSEVITHTGLLSVIGITVIEFRYFTEWKKTFLLFPKKTIKGKRLWFEVAYKRTILSRFPRSMKPKQRKRVEYATLIDILTDE